MNQVFYIPLSFGFFYNLYLISLYNTKFSEPISKTIPSLTHSIVSTVLSGICLLYFNEYNYYYMSTVAIGYFMSDSLHSIIEINKPGRKMLLIHHIITILCLLFPPNYKITWVFFLSELSNIPGQFTYLLIKIKQPKPLIMISKKYQYWSFYIGRIFLWPFALLFSDYNLSTSHIFLLYILFIPIYCMSCFWMVKLHLTYYK